MARMAHADDFALSRVTPDAQKHWFGIAVQRFGQVSALSQFLLGATLGYAMTFSEAFLALLLGSIILEVIMCIVGIIGQKEGLNTALLARWTGFGEIGASLVGLAIGISLIGWFGIQSAISAESLDSLLPGLMPMWAWSLLFGLAVTAIVAVGFVGMQWLANITVPLFLVLVGWSIITELSNHSIGDLLTSPAPGPTMSVWQGTAIVAGGLIVGAIITADMTRFNRSKADVVKQTVVGVSLGEFVIGLSGVLLAHAAQTGNIVAIVTSSVGLVGLIIVITGTLKINDWNLYSSTLGLVNFISTAFGKNLNRVSTTIVLGVVGSILAAAGILSQFTGFLIILGVVFPPIAGIMVAEYFIVRRWRGELDASRAEGRLPLTAPRLVPVTLVVWLVSALVGYFVTWGIPAISSLVLSIVLYTVAGKLGWVRGVGEATTAQAPVRDAAPVAS
ncbi:cytosine permease [Microbacterium testaceum]|uniref:purine-cytosine permease family protein n=1 Tax=Microbacterium TaxID=33882 RepID=UPI001AE8710E|nr:MULTISPECIES: cytosine permease [Microbacterium]MDQ1111464.1 cytosine permease [Microbacterium testaceum]MDQ1175612.1 cytosine permease [Microbacterium sp. SORGH_AS_0421]MDR6097999.1 cytosine permease [Microbacterium sp. SORGH_AS_0454]